MEKEQFFFLINNRVSDLLGSFEELDKKEFSEI
jgi:hypothetical protein